MSHRTPQLVEAAYLQRRLDAFGDEREAQCLPVTDDSARQLTARVGIPELRDQRSGDLEDVDRKAAKLRQRRVPGPDVVDGDVDARPLQGVEDGDGAVEILEDRVLGDLEDEAGRIDLHLLDASGHVVYELTPQQRAG